MLNSDESVVLQELLLNVHTLHPERNPLLFLTCTCISVEKSSWSVEGNYGKQMMPELLTKHFSESHTLQIFKEPYDTSP